MEKLTLPLWQVSRYLARINGRLGAADVGRLEKLGDLVAQTQGQTLNLQEVLDRLYPEHDGEKALAALRHFRSGLNEALEKLKIPLSIEVDSRKKSSPAQRSMFFVGESRLEQEVAEHSEQSVRLAHEKPQVGQRGLADKLEVRYFVSYAHTDKKPMAELLERLRQFFRLSNHFKYLGWQDGDILSNDEKWHDQIQTAISGCNFGLNLLSVRFLGSKYIIEHEMKHFMPSEANPHADRFPIWVGLHNIDFTGKYDLKGIQEYQVFRLEDGDRIRSFNECGTNTLKERFAEKLFDKIEQSLLKRYMGENGDTPQRSDTLLPHEPLVGFPSRDRKNYAQFPSMESEYEAFFQQRKPEQSCLEIASFAQTRGMDYSFQAPRFPQHDATVEVQAFLMDWARDPEREPYCALLGELGMGKTFNAQILTRRLLESREKDRSLPLPIYLDLRELRLMGQRQPDLETIIQEILKEDWKSGNRAAFLAGEVLRLVREEGALLIFDGLDERLVHLSESEGQYFIRRLWSALPPNLFTAPNPRPNARTGKLLLTCRTHYFRNTMQQISMLRGEGRDGLEKHLYTSILLLPFRTDQIREYIRIAFGENELDRIVDLIESVHNLMEMAERPLTLEYIRELVPDLEALRKRGEAVYSVTLYRLMTERWLERDAGKHRFSVRHKRLLMENLAATMWKEQVREWRVERLENWLEQFLLENPALHNALHSVPAEVLQEDLRTATFIVRPDEDRFRFAHTSLLEYFLAGHLHRGLQAEEERLRKSWSLPTPSHETFTFLAQMAMGEEAEACQRGVRRILAAYHPLASENVLRLVLQGSKEGFIVPDLAQMDMRGANLERFEFRGTEISSLQFSEADFSGARLERARFQHVDLRRANLSQACLDLAEFINCDMSGADLQEAGRSGTIFRHVDARGIKLDAGGSEAQWLGCRFDSPSGPGQGIIAPIANPAVG